VPAENSSVGSDLLNVSGEDVAPVSHRFYQVEFNVAELSANPAEEHVDGPIEDIAIAPVGRVKQVFARQHPSGPRYQRMQEIEFGRGQVKQRAARVKNAPQSRLQLETLETVFPGRMHNLVCAILAAKDRSNASREFSRIEWLAEIIIGAKLKADYSVGVLL
jgi:hypothetical protein